VPQGWTIVHKSDTRAACLDYVNRNWTDMRPKSLIEKMKQKQQQQQQNGGQPRSH
jgi:MbtH protein